MNSPIRSRAWIAALAVVALVTVATAGGASAALRRGAAPAAPPVPEAPETPAAPEAAQQAWLGVELQDVAANMAKALKLPDGDGALVSRVVEDSPAATGGLEDGDVVVRFGGDRVRDADALTTAVRDAKPGDEVKVVVVRDGREKTLAVTLGKRQVKKMVLKLGEGDQPGDLALGLDQLHRRLKAGDDKQMQLYLSPESFSSGSAPFLGVQMTPLSDQLGRYFGAPAGQGVLVGEVVADSPADEAGLAAGDIILRVGDREISAPEDVRKALAKAEAGDKVEITVLRDHAERTLAATLAEPREGAGGGGMSITPGAGGGQNWIVRRYGTPEAGGSDRKVIIRRLGDDPDGESDSDEVTALRDELRDLRREVEKLKQQLHKSR
jgi:serine protease Do